MYHRLRLASALHLLLSLLVEASHTKGSHGGRRERQTQKAGRERDRETERSEGEATGSHRKAQESRVPPPFHVSSHKLMLAVNELSSGMQHFPFFP